jgi:hypothetical protein
MPDAASYDRSPAAFLAAIGEFGGFWGAVENELNAADYDLPAEVTSAWDAVTAFYNTAVTVLDRFENTAKEHGLDTDAIEVPADYE